MVTNAEYTELDVKCFELEKTNKLYRSMLATAQSAIENIYIAVYAGFKWENDPNGPLITKLCHDLTDVSDIIKHILSTTPKRIV